MPAPHPSSETPFVRIVTRPAAVSAIAAVVARLTDWAQRHRQRRALARLDADLLRDVGLTRADALRESGKPFWRR